MSGGSKRQTPHCVAMSVRTQLGALSGKKRHTEKTTTWLNRLSELFTFGSRSASHSLPTPKACLCLITFPSTLFPSNILPSPTIFLRTSAPAFILGCFSLSHSLTHSQARLSRRRRSSSRSREGTPRPTHEPADPQAPPQRQQVWNYSVEVVRSFFSPCFSLYFCFEPAAGQVLKGALFLNGNEGYQLSLFLYNTNAGRCDDRKTMHDGIFGDEEERLGRISGLLEHNVFLPHFFTMGPTHPIAVVYLIISAESRV